MTEQTISAIPLILFDKEEGQFNLQPEAKSFLASLNKPFEVVSVAGMYRTGKSYLLNRLILNKQKGFKVGGSTNACTKGLWLFPELIEHNDTAVLVIDTEGIGSTDVDSNYDNKIFTLAVLLSSCFIYNSLNTIDENAINSLSFVVNMTKHIQLKSNKSNDLLTPEEFSSYLPSFLWVLRDFSLDLLDENNRKISSKEYLEQSLKEQQGYSDSVVNKNHIRKVLKDFFTDRDCFTLIRPVMEENSLKKMEDLGDEELRPEFLKQVNLLKEKIFTNLKAKRSESKRLNGDMYTLIISTYLEAINKGGIPNVEGTWSKVCELESQKCFDNFKQEVDKFKENIEFPLEKEVLSAKIAAFSAEMKEELKFVFVGDYSSQLETGLDNLLSQTRTELIRENKQKSIKACQTVLSEEKSRLLNSEESHSLSSSFKNVIETIAELDVDTNETMIGFSQLADEYLEKEKERLEMEKDEHYQQIINDERVKNKHIQQEFDDFKKSSLESLAKKEDDIQFMTLEIESINAKYSTLKTEFESLNSKFSELSSQKVQNEADLNNQISNLKIDLEKAQNKVKQIENESEQELKEKIEQIKRLTEDDNSRQVTNKEKISDLEEKLEIQVEENQEQANTIELLEEKLSQQQKDSLEQKANFETMKSELNAHFEDILAENRKRKTQAEEDFKVKLNALKDKNESLFAAIEELKAEKLSITTELEKNSAKLVSLKEEFKEKEEKILSIEKKEAELVEMLSQSSNNKQIEDDLRKLESSHKAELTRLEQNFKERVEVLEEDQIEKTKTITSLKNKNDSLSKEKEALNTDLSQLEASSSKKIEELQLEIIRVTEERDTSRKEKTESELRLKEEANLRFAKEKAELMTKHAEIVDKIRAEKNKTVSDCNIQIEMEQAELEEKLKNLHLEFESQREELENDHLNALEEKEETIMYQEDELRNKQDYINRLETVLKTLETKLEEKNEQLASTIEKYDSNLQRLEESYKQMLSDSRESAKKDISELTVKFDGCNSELSSLRVEHKTVSHRLQAEEKKTSELETKLQETSHELGEKRMELNSLNALSTQEKALREERIAELKQMLNEIEDKANKRLEEAKKELEAAFKTKVNKISREKTELETKYIARKEKFRTDENKLKNQITLLNKEKVALTSKVQLLEERKKDILEAYKTKVETLKKELENASVNGVDTDSEAAEALQNAKLKINDLENQLNSLTEVYSQKETQLKEKINQLNKEKNAVEARNREILKKLNDNSNKEKEEQGSQYKEWIREIEVKNENNLAEMKKKNEGIVRLYKEKVQEGFDKLKEAQEEKEEQEKMFEQKLLVLQNTLRDAESKLMLLEEEKKSGHRAFASDLEGEFGKAQEEWDSLIEKYQSRCIKAEQEKSELESSFGASKYAWLNEKRALERKLAEAKNEVNKHINRKETLIKRNERLRQRSGSRSREYGSHVPRPSVETETNKENISVMDNETLEYAFTSAKKLNRSKVARQLSLGN